MRCLLAIPIFALGCADVVFIDEARVAPFALHLSDDRVVLTPGGRTRVRIAIERSEPDPAHPVQLEISLIGASGGVTATLDTANTKDDVAMIAIEAPASAAAQELAFTVRGALGPYSDEDPLAVSVQIPGPLVPGVEEHAPGVDGEIKTIVLDGQPITFEVIDGLAIAGGDVILGDALDLASRNGLFSATCNPSFHTDFNCSQWTDGVIGYSFADNWGANNDAMHVQIEAAIALWEAVTPIRFVRRASGEYVEFSNGSGCSSRLGRAVLTGEDPQRIFVTGGCSVAHEIGHAIGLYHEQQRNDRSDYVTIDYSKVAFGNDHNFYTWGPALVDRGLYNYDSIMHYNPWSFARDVRACAAGAQATPPDFSECPLRPISPIVTGMGPDGVITEGDILGVYSLYPPEYEITGAGDGVDDRFFLALDFSTPTPSGDRIEWTSDRVPGAVLGHGTHITLNAAVLPLGTNVITAAFKVAGYTVTQRSVTLTISNAAPVVTLATRNGSMQQQLNQVFDVIATVSDAEDGSCDDCFIEWLPAPTVGPTDRHSASYQFATLGPRMITVRVVDHGGTSRSASVVVDIVNTPPTAVILRPAAAIEVRDGTAVLLGGRGFDPNDPDGVLPCSALVWSSSNPADVLGPPSCSSFVFVHGPGTHTISLVANDGIAASTPATVDITVTSCTAAGCAPTAFLELSPPDVADAHFIERELTITMTFADVEVDSESGSPITYRLTARRAGEPTITSLIASGTVTAWNPNGPVSAAATWTPIADIPGAGWPFCSAFDNYRDYELVLEATDSSGMITTTTQIVRLGCDLI